MKRIAAVATMLAALGLAMPAGAQNKTVYFLSWGGTVQATLEKDGWNKRFTEATGYEVVLVPKATGPEIIAAAIAQKEHPQVDVVQTDLLPFLAGDQQGIFAPLDDKGVPNLDKMAQFARFNSDGVMTYGDIFAIIYNEEVFKKNGWAPPKADWHELLRPEFAGKLVLPPLGTTYGSYTLIALAHVMGGDEHNIEPGWAALKKLAPGVVEWPTTFARMGQFLQDETAAIGLYTASTAEEMKKRGIPVNYVIPKPVLFSGSAAGIMKNAPNPEGAKAFLNWWISKDFLTYRQQVYNNLSLHLEVPSKAMTVEDIKAMTPVDFAYVNAQQTAWTERFENEILKAR